MVDKLGPYELNSIIYGDTTNLIDAIPDESVDLIITSPPYNINETTGGGFPKQKGKWAAAKLRIGYEANQDKIPPEQYKTWQQALLKKWWRVIKPTGAIFYNHKPRVQNGILHTPLEFNPGLPIRQIIIWKRAGGINFSPTHYLPTHEWIIVFAKPDFRLKSKGASGAGDVWEFPQESNSPHPAPFPVQLPETIIETTAPGLVLDPFMGSGTTAVAAVKYGVDYLGFDNEPTYITWAQERITRITADLNGEWKRINGNSTRLDDLPLFVLGPEAAEAEG